MNPMQAAQNRTARLAREAVTPIFVSTREGAEARSRRALLLAADDCAGEEYCFICRRSTDHRGEHDDEQLLAFARSARGRQLMSLR